MPTKKTNKRSAVKAGKRKPGQGLVDMTGRGRTGVKPKIAGGKPKPGAGRRPATAGRKPKKVTGGGKS